MFDCLDRQLPAFDGATPATPGAQATSKPQRCDSLALTRRYAGRSWALFRPRSSRQAELAQLREVALYLNAGIERQADGSLLLLDLSLSATLALSERFGQSLAVEANIALGGQAS